MIGPAANVLASEARLLNGLELVELMTGCASGTHEKHGNGTGMLISALRHGSTCVTFIAKWMRL